MASRVGFMITNNISACPFQHERRLRERRVRLVPPRVTAKHGGAGDIPPQQKLMLDRRDVLLALGGSAAATTAGGVILPAMAAPVAPPDLSKCHNASSSSIGDDLKCCPPYTTADIVEYNFPRSPLRVRRAAQLVKDDKEYMEKYKLAIQKMKELKDDDPWNFYQQALVHCAYCNNAYDQTGYPGVPLKVHFSWLFLPWHRYYLHFFERILGKLINDETFALPFWNFDAKDGMTLPSIFTEDTSSPLYNDLRDKRHQGDAIVDYKYSYTGTGETGDALIEANLSIMRNTFKEGLQYPPSFMGGVLRAGESKTETTHDEQTIGAGGIENIHNKLHQWVGRLETPYTDMGDFSTAARDCIFYCLHGNVDRLWHLYRNLRGHRLEFDDNDWLDATFIFYNENRQVVSVKLRDCLNPTKLRYTYEEVPVPWMRSIRPRKTAETKQKDKDELKLVKVSEFGTQPRELGTTPLRVIVSRPQKNRKKLDKEDEVEILKVTGIEVTTKGPATFDVYVAAPYGDLAGPDFGHFAGSFTRLPHGMKGMGKGKGRGKAENHNLFLGITAILEDIEAEDAEKLVVTLVPRDGTITVGGVEIKLVKADMPRLLG